MSSTAPITITTSSNYTLSSLSEFLRRTSVAPSSDPISSSHQLSTAQTVTASVQGSFNQTNSFPSAPSLPPVYACPPLSGTRHTLSNQGPAPYPYNTGSLSAISHYPASASYYTASNQGPAPYPYNTGSLSAISDYPTSASHYAASNQGPAPYPYNTGSLSAISHYPASASHYTASNQGPAPYPNTQPVQSFPTWSNYTPQQVQEMALQALLQNTHLTASASPQPITISPAPIIAARRATHDLAPLANSFQRWVPFEQGKEVRITNRNINGKMASLDYNTPVNLQNDTEIWLEKTNYSAILPKGCSLYATEEIDEYGMRIYTIETPIDSLGLKFGDRLIIPFNAPEPSHIIIDYTTHAGTDPRTQIIFNLYSESVHRDYIENL